jgi:AraC-like DNA-binding protein
MDYPPPDFHSNGKSSEKADKRFDKMHVADITLALGFEGISYFNRLFRRHFGKTPNDARNSR